MTTENKSIVSRLFTIFKDKIDFRLKDAYCAVSDVPQESVRARIYEHIDISFQRVRRGVYKVVDNQAILINGNGRDLSFLNDNSIDLILTDHAWFDEKSNKGGNRKFTDYPTYRYTQDDFNEKARVLTDGSFLVEVLPAENENNFEYLYEIKEMAKKAGFKYYSKVSWIKGSFVSNTGRKAKNTEDVMIFSKGKAKALRLNVKKMNKMADGKKYFMSGTRKMLPTSFNVQAVSRKETNWKTEKPIELFKQILSYLSFEGDIILDQNAGSGAVNLAAAQTNRKSIGIEIMKSACNLIKKRFNEEKLPLLYFE